MKYEKLYLSKYGVETKAHVFAVKSPDECYQIRDAYISDDSVDRVILG